MNISTLENIPMTPGITVSNDTVSHDRFLSLKSDVNEPLQRIGSRYTTLGLMAILSDGKLKYFCIVDELSLEGLRLTQIPADFDDTVMTSTVIILAPFCDVKISLNRCWVKITNRGMYKTIGYQIDNSSVDWPKFVKEMEEDEKHHSFLLADYALEKTT